MTKKSLVIVGAGGHAKVVADIAASSRAYRLAGAVDADPNGKAARASGLELLGTDDELKKLFSRGVRSATIGVGSIGDTRARAKLRALVESLGFELPVLAHPASVVARSARLGPGCQVMAASVINPGCRVGRNCVINTGAVLEHDCVLGDDAFVGPVAALGGDVKVGDGAFIGIGAVVLQGVKIGARALVGAGAVVTKDVLPDTTVVGVPARPR